MFFCVVCVEDVELHPTDMCNNCCIAVCPECGTKLRTQYARPENPTEEMLGLSAYNEFHGVDNSTP